LASQTFRDSFSDPHFRATSLITLVDLINRLRTQGPSTNIDDEEGDIVTTTTTDLSQPADKHASCIIDKRTKDILGYMLNRCIFPQTCIADFIVGVSVMPSQFLDYVTALLGEGPIDLIVSGPWIPPKFEDVHDYYIKLCRENHTDIEFGIYEGKPVTICPIGKVKCWDGDTDSFRGEGTLTINCDYGVKEYIRVSVLGCISGNGTGVLIDEVQRVWLYNPFIAVDAFLPGALKRQAFGVMKSDDVMQKDTLWKVVEMYPEPTLKFDPESDDESNDEELDLFSLWK
jgi:hypothetical protein